MSTLSTGVDVSAEGNEEEDALKTLRGERSKIRNDFAVRILKEEDEEEEKEEEEVVVVRGQAGLWRGGKVCTLTLSKNCGDLEELRQGENLQTGGRENSKDRQKYTDIGSYWFSPKIWCEKAALDYVVCIQCVFLLCDGK